VGADPLTAAGFHPGDGDKSPGGTGTANVSALHGGNAGLEKAGGGAAGLDLAIGVIQSQGEAPLLVWAEPGRLSSNPVGGSGVRGALSGSSFIAVLDGGLPISQVNRPWSGVSLQAARQNGVSDNMPGTSLHTSEETAARDQVFQRIGDQAFRGGPLDRWAAAWGAGWQDGALPDLAAAEVRVEGADGGDLFSPTQDARIGLETLVVALAGAYASYPPEEAVSREDRRPRRR
jgi:hypothetical protein